MSNPASPTSAECDSATSAALAALMRLIAADATDDSSVDEALAAVLGADEESALPAAVHAASLGDDSRAPEESTSSPLDRIVQLPPGTPQHIRDEVGASTSGLTPLEFAVLRQNIHAARSLLRAGAHVDRIGGFSCTSLCKTCYSCPENIEMMRLLLAAGANPDATTNNDTSSASCLIISVVKNNGPAVSALLEYGADVSYEWKGSNALAMALDFKKLDIAQLFETFELRKAQQNRWMRFQQRKKAEEDRLAAARTPTQRQRSVSPVVETIGVASSTAQTSTATAAVEQPVETAVPKTPEAKALDAMKSPQHDGSPRSQLAAAQLADSLTSMDWLIPLSEIEILSPISSGAHGQVFRAKLKSTGDIVALKKFPCHDARSREIFRREVDMLAKFRHENIVMFKGAVMDFDCSAMLTELCSESLFERLERSGPLPWSLRLRWAREMAKGMTYLHARSPPVVHRDLKSMNVLLDHSGTVKLCDFGIARLREHTFVETQHIAGSPSWMAPEVLRGDDFNQTSDVYAFGVVMWELITRSVPWPNKSMAQLVGLVGFTGATLEVPSKLPEDCPPRFVELMKSCFLPADQRPTFRKLREDLDALIVDVD